MTEPQPTVSDYLLRPLRSEEEVRALRAVNELRKDDDMRSPAARNGCGVCGRAKVWHGSEHPMALPGTYLIESGCHDGVHMDDDEYHEGWQPDVIYPPCPHHPKFCKECGGRGEADGGDCDKCDGTGWLGDPEWPPASDSEPRAEGEGTP